VQGGHKPLIAGGVVPGRHEARSDIEVFFIDLTQSHTLLDAEEQRTPRLSAADHKRAESMSADRERRRLWRDARIATRIVLERAGGVGLRNVDFDIAAGGRPGLGPGDPYFNVSHSGDVALVAVSKEMPMGVDLEKKRTLTMSDDRRRRIIAAAERLAPQPPLSADSAGDVLIAWVRLEAAAKARGTGIGQLLTEHGVIGGKREDRAQGSARTLEIRNLAVPDDYVAAVAAARLPKKIAVHSFPTDNLLEFIAGASS
jgi:4'-phosphopantetheinyl transferase